MLKVKLNLDNHNDWKTYCKIIEIVVHYGICKESELTENNCPQIANNIYNDFLDNSRLSFNFTNLEDFIINRKNIKYWICGHCHRDPIQFEIGQCKVLMNTRGYCKFNECPSFKEDFIVEM